ncbi:hypothetical protein KQX62_19255 [Rhodopseudomonas palustris]|uniref:Uncharacterized protein n=1 Tax=Rhodopseudomonas palustris TaxID=1076 RepID=A0AAX3DWD2_RHOPL|nr:hypothetical protein [Rhodopseudomonas palustris]UYO38839.1 hypothetical protein KQX62_19255 [Rhodopseudomonas palustris]
MAFLQLLSAAGIGGIIGSLLTTLLQAWFAHRATLATRNFQEKKEAYLGFLEALHRSDVEKTRETSMTAGHWRNRCELVASKDVIDSIHKIFETNPGPFGEMNPARPRAIEDLRQAMRRDLGVDTRE